MPNIENLASNSYDTKARNMFLKDKTPKTPFEGVGERLALRGESKALFGFVFISQFLFCSNWSKDHNVSPYEIPGRGCQQGSGRPYFDGATPRAPTIAVRRNPRNMHESCNKCTKYIVLQCANPNNTCDAIQENNVPPQWSQDLVLPFGLKRKL